MEKTILGASGLAVSRVCLGTAGYGAAIPQAAALAQLDTYRELGGNFLDTARCYNDWIPGERHRSEKTLGKWMKARNCRGEMVLSTKGGHPPFENMHAPRLAPQELDADLEGSLRDLQTDYIDLYFLHRDDERRSVGDILEHLERKVREGKILHYGCSNWRLPRVLEAAAYAAAHGLQGFCCDQIMW
ncbi:MAG: aldo/keto reductase, partial [Eubacteriales bacterium]|nr:aldo/keto reductase [Eubacteriales bacterium]